jgi:hypothetical protein
LANDPPAFTLSRGFRRAACRQRALTLAVPSAPRPGPFLASA